MTSTESSTETSGRPNVVPSSDPRVRKLVYSMYRDMLKSCNDEANDFISQKDPSLVTTDTGIRPILDSIISRQRGGSGGVETNSVLEASPGLPTSVRTSSSTQLSTTGMSPPPPPPPPPMAPSGGIPSARLNSEIGPRDTRGPPLALAGAMMKDKKPFTYTPGGIDLSDIRSPRMAKRIQMNAAAEGVCSVPQQQPHHQQQQQSSDGSSQSAPHTSLPPAALAAMNPAMAIPVLPQGAFNNNLNRTQKPTDFVRQEHESQQQSPAGPRFMPPNLQQQIQQHHQLRQTRPAPQRFEPSPASRKSPSPPQSRFANREDSNFSQAPNNFSGHSSGLSQPMMSSGNQSPGGNNDERGISSDFSSHRASNRRSASPVKVSGTGRIYIPPLSNPTSNQQSSSPTTSHYEQQNPPPARPTQTRAQAQSQNLGSIYIPPLDQRENLYSDRTGSASSKMPNYNASASSPTLSSSSDRGDSPAKTPTTPQLNKAPTPWMNSYNRTNSQQSSPGGAESPNAPPWGTSLGMARAIPISMSPGQQSNSSANNTAFDQGQVRAVTTPPLNAQQQQRLQRQISQLQQEEQQQRQKPNANRWNTTPTTPQPQETNYPPGRVEIIMGRVVPINANNENTGTGGQRHIPIQIEGKQSFNNVSGSQNSSLPASSHGLYSNSTANASNSYSRPAAELSSGMNRMNVKEDSPKMDSSQSMPFNMTTGVTAHQSNDEEQQQTSEPRFRGGHIPSRAFRTLQINLQPSQQGFTSEPLQSQGGPVVHNIPIRILNDDPSASSLNGQERLPPSQQQREEPKKYMGGHIPSRAFKILQTMTSTDDNNS